MSIGTRLGIFTAGAAFAAVTLSAAPVQADKLADFYKGRDVRIILPYSVGGSYGGYGRLVGRHLGKYIPGNPNFITDHSKRGGGGLRGANYIYNQAPKDGSEIAILADALAVTQLLFPKRAKYDVAKMRYIGRVTPVNPVIVIRGDRKVKSAKDAMKTQIIISCSGKGSQGYIMPRALKVIVGMKIRQVCGYKGSAPQTLAIERGDVDGQSSAWASWKFRRPDALKSGKLIPLVQIGLEKEADLPNIPLMQDLTDDKEKKAILEFLSVGGAIGRSVILPPGVPAEKVKMFRDAFQKMLKDPAFLADAKKQRLHIGGLSGEGLDKISSKALATPKGLVKQAQLAIVKGKVEKCKTNCVRKKKKKK